MKSRIIIPETFMGIPIKGAIERVLKEEKNKPEVQMPTHSTPLVVNPDIIKHDYVHIPGSDRVISRFENQGYNNLNWQDTHYKLQDNGLYMPSPSLFMQHFMNVVNSYKNKGKTPLFDASGNTIPKSEVEDIYKHLTKNHIAAYGTKDAGAWSWLDAKFEADKILSDHQVKVLSGTKSLHPGKTENLEAHVTKDSLVDLTFNSQGLPTQPSSSQKYRQGDNIYFYHPRNGAVARFDADSGRAYLFCDRDPSNRYPSLGVFAVSGAGS